MSRIRIVWLDARAEAEDKAIGPKAASLVRLLQIGLPVPAGFCLPVGAYREHIQTNGLVPLITSLKKRGHSTFSPSAEPENAGQNEKVECPLFRCLEEIREAIVRAPMSETTRGVIETHYRELGATYVAVRSSATAEDLPGQSFAGQYDTILGLSDVEECLTAVKQCWASLWTERAWKYRQQNGLDPLAVGMAVIVQTFVPADASGVLFTVDPTNGHSDRITIESCFGLGEALVSGRVTPDRFLVRKRDLRLVSRTISNKAIRSVLDQHGGVRQGPVAPGLASRSSLERHTVIRLARLGKQAEAGLGEPQDMEWAVQGTRVFFLQSRPITAVARAASWEEQQVWTNANLGEVLPDVMTPMTASITDLTNDTLLRPALTVVGLENLPRDKFLRLIAGRLYFNATMGLALAQRLPGGRRFDYRALIGGAPTTAGPDGQVEIPSPQVSSARVLLRVPWVIRLVLAHRQKNARAALRQLQEINCRLQEVDFSRIPPEELGRQFTALVREGSAKFDLFYAVLATAPLALLYKVCARWLGDTEGAIANRLLGDAGDMASARAGLDLWRLAAQARAVPAVRDILLAGSDWQGSRKSLAFIDDGRAFLQGWDRFMACHGHHCRGEIELYNPRWSETPDYILPILRSYLLQANPVDPERDRQQRTHRWEQLQEQCLRRLRNPIERRVFVHLVRAARSGSVLRENFKNEGIRWIATLRRMLLEIGTGLTRTGVLTEPDDVFFLQWQELEELSAGSNRDVATLISERRAEYQRNKSILPPKIVMGSFDPCRPIPSPRKTGEGESSNTLRGVPAGAGIATGKARVILRADTNEQVQAGEILVAPFTDPGWTPYFVPAAGIVAEQGGLLSHGSIIAREYGLPAVVNVPAATQIIRTGQTLRVDGNRGVVTILP